MSNDEGWERRRREFHGSPLSMVVSDQSHEGDPASRLAWPEAVRRLPMSQQILRGPEYLGERFRAFLTAAAWAFQAEHDAEDLFRSRRLRRYRPAWNEDAGDEPYRRSLVEEAEVWLQRQGEVSFVP